MGEHVSITMSVSVALIRAFLPLFFLISATAAEEKCSHLKGKVELQWIPEYEKFHEGLGLIFDCDAMQKADASAVKLKAGDKNYLVGEEWCQYSRLVWDPFYADYLASQTVPMDTMPRDKANKRNSAATSEHEIWVLCPHVHYTSQCSFFYSVYLQEDHRRSEMHLQLNCHRYLPFTVRHSIVYLQMGLRYFFKT
ncbi:hypothetical protein Q1695_015933 [Nippostrongylus brasiliensis]|nr:hypothetical protein Q1695_015933 [Nippostrongylus brasiliensis]